MTAPSSIDPSRFLAESGGRVAGLLCSMLTTFINTLMSAEADAMCGAPYGASSPDRTNTRNSYRSRDFDTRAGTLDVAIPKLRSGSYFPDWLLERRRRAEAALTTVVATCYLLGVSTRRMEKLVETLGITRLSKSQVSVMAAELDAHVADFRSRRWTPARTRSSPPTRWCSRSARAAGSSTSTRCSPPVSTPTGTGRSSACRSPAQRTAPAGSGSSATSPPATSPPAA